MLPTAVLHKEMEAQKCDCNIDGVLKSAKTPVQGCPLTVRSLCDCPVSYKITQTISESVKAHAEKDDHYATSVKATIGKTINVDAISQFLTEKCADMKTSTDSTKKNRKRTRMQTKLTPG